jgi:hypothetical protein
MVARQMKNIRMRFIAPILLAMSIPIMLINSDTPISSSVIYIYPFLILGYFEYYIGAFFTFFLVAIATLGFNSFIAYFNVSLLRLLLSFTIIFIFLNILTHGSAAKIEDVAGVIFAFVYYFFCSFFGQELIYNLIQSTINLKDDNLK